MEQLGILTGYPWLALVVAGCLAILWRWARSKVAAVAAILWAGYAGYEYLMLTRVLCTGECNIRVDLLLIYPLLVLLLLAAVAASIRARIVKQRAA
ncbi:MAG TPA: hypothetical protein VFZ23_17840 [Pyrinomonadaceae bacterium]